MRFIAVVLLAAIALPASASAQSQLPPVIVTATRFPDDANRLPASVTVLSAADIQKSAARTLPEILAEQVGLTMKDLFGNNAAFTSVDMRGFGVTGGQNTLILVDGRRVSDPDLSGVYWSAIPLSSIERIEILRGTGAVLYGDGATAGVINIVMRSPLEQGRRAELMGRVANYRTLEGQIYGSVVSPTLGANTTLHMDNSDGYRENNRNEQQNAALNLRWGPGDTWIDLRLGIDRQNLRLPGARAVQASNSTDELASDRRGAQTPLDSSSRDSERAGVTVETKIGKAELNIGVDWRGKEMQAYFDFGGGFSNYRDDALDVISLTPRLRLPVTLAGMQHRFTLGDDWHAWSYDSHRSDHAENIATPINIVRVDQDMQGWYLQDAIELSAKSLLTLGWRQDRVKYDATDVFDASAPGAGFGSEAPAASQTQHQHAWEVGLRHSTSASTALFGRAQRSFRFVNADEIYEPNETFSNTFQILRPQTAQSYELGAEWRAEGRAVRVTLFQMDIDDEIHLDAFTTGTGNTNLPPSRRKGVEVETMLQATTKLGLLAGYAFTDAKFLDGVLPGGPFVIGTDINIAGKKVPLVPEHKLNLGMVWDVMDGTRLSASFTSLSKQYMDNDEPNTLGIQIPAYSLLDVKVAREFGWGRLAASVNNLLDEQYYTYGVRSQFTADRYAVYPLPGRGFNLMAVVRID